MERRTFLIGVGGTALGGSALLGTGAFTRVESQRRVKIEVAEDPDAYLGLDGCPDSPNSSYTEFEDGHLAVEMSQYNPTDAGGAGINSDSRSYFDDVFQICNQGKQPVCVWIGDETWPTYDETGENRVEFYTGASHGADDLNDLGEQSIVGVENAILLDVGGCVCVGLAVVSKGLTEGEQVLEDLDNEIVIHADADEECVPEIEPDETRFDIHLAYQDLGADEGGDYDYNDWLVDIDATFFGTGLNGNPGEVALSGIDLEFEPLAKSAGLEHAFQLVDDNGVIDGDNCSGEYELEVVDEDGTVVRTDSGAFNGGDETIVIFESTNEVFDPDDEFEENKWNADPAKEVDCADPIRTATLELTFDEPCTFDFDAFDPVGAPDEPHGQELFFNPKLTWDDNGGEVERGDIELLTVPAGWPWPVENASIWDVYDEVNEDNGQPDFPEDEWRPPLEDFEGDEDLLFDLC